MQGHHNKRTYFYIQYVVLPGRAPSCSPQTFSSSSSSEEDEEERKHHHQFALSPGTSSSSFFFFLLSSVLLGPTVLVETREASLLLPTYGLLSTPREAGKRSRNGNGVIVASFAGDLVLLFMECFAKKTRAHNLYFPQKSL